MNLDAQLAVILPLDEWGKESLQNAQDSCLVPDKKLLIIADDIHGVLVFDLSGNLQKRLPDIKDASSICYDSFNKRVIVNLIKSVPAETDPPGTLHVLDLNSWKCTKLLDLPSKPSINRAYTRWICADPRNGDIFMACGDNENAALLKLDISSLQWKVLLERKGDLEHPFIIPIKGDNLRLLLAAWDNDNNWRILQVELDGQDKITKESTVLKEGAHVREPWIAICDQEEKIYAFDYKTGFIFENKHPYEKNEPIPIGFVGKGQWVTMEIADGWLFVVCSEQSLVKKFRLM